MQKLQLWTTNGPKKVSAFEVLVLPKILAFLLIAVITASVLAITSLSGELKKLEIANAELVQQVKESSKKLKEAEVYVNQLKVEYTKLKEATK